LSVSNLVQIKTIIKYKILLLSDKTFVLSVANGVSANVNALSPTSNSLKLEGGVTSVNEILTSQLEIYPNPASSEINIKLKEGIENIEIYSMTGQLMFSKDVKSENCKLNISGLSKGTYTVIINTKEAKAVKKIIVE
jgi:hypothetical protein